MKRHLAYLKYLLRHKWFVLIASTRYVSGVSLWRALTHDMSKFLPSEFVAYAYTFYNEDGSPRYEETQKFNVAWLKHQHRNPHHWQYWVLRMDDGGTEALPMPAKYVKEMVADWLGAGRAINGEWGCVEWYLKNKDKMLLHPSTRCRVEFMLNYLSAVTFSE